MTSLDLILLLSRHVFIWMILGFFIAYALKIPLPIISSFAKWVCVNFTFPCLICKIVIEHLKPSEIPKLIYFGFAALFFIFFAFIISQLIAKVFKIHQALSTYHLGNSFQNYGFIVYALSGILFGPSILPKLFVFVLVTEFMLWTWGLRLLKKKEVKLLKALLNAPVLAMILSISIVIYFPNFRLEHLSFIEPLISISANIAIPLVLTTIGGILYHSMKNFKGKDLSSREFISSILLRHILIPSIIIPLSALCLHPSDLRNIILIESIMPMALMPVTMASVYSGNHHSLGITVSISHLLCIVTIPTWLLFLHQFGLLSF